MSIASFRLPAVALVALGAVSGAGCLSSTHRIPNDELLALSHMEPAARAGSVRVVQNLGHQSEPPPAPQVHTHTHVVIGGPVWVGGHPERRGPNAVITSEDGSSRSVAPARGGDVADSKKEDAKVLLVLAAIAAGALAVTEGARYDGWVQLHPMHPVHLYGADGYYTWMPLADVTPDVALWAERAYVREGEGPWNRLGRAPLDRRGFTYSMFLGAGEIPLMGADPKTGFMSHIDLGYFPTQKIGLGFDIGFGWTDDEIGETVFDARYALEAQVMPVAAGRFHAGVYGQFGGASLSDDGIQLDESSLLLAGGGLLQLDITTRLALSLRAGITAVHGETLSELTAGVSIY